MMAFPRGAASAGWFNDMGKRTTILMTNRAPEKLLIGVDESERAFQVAVYLSKIPSFKKKQVVLLNVSSEIPESYWDLGEQQLFGGGMAGGRGWTNEKQKEIDNHLERARQVLLNAGFDGDAVIATSKKREKGFARDIINEAKDGYEAVAIGRRGMSKLADLVLGSMATKLLQAVYFAPLLLIGKNSSSDKVLVAFDGSENAMRAVNYAANTLGGGNCRVDLIHVIRSEDRIYPERPRKEIAEGLEKSRSRLEQSGFKSDRVGTKMVPGEEGRAGAIIREARQGGYGTIIVGRRGWSELSEFFMGTVSNKVVYLARGLAVWVVN
jgi:nucleotide-binding universal stress UspA family protein